MNLTKVRKKVRKKKSQEEEEHREVEEKHDEGNKCDVTKTIKTSAKQREETRRRLKWGGAPLWLSGYKLRRGSVRQLRDANALDQIIRLISHSKHHQSAKKSPISQTRSPTAPLTLVWLTDTSHWLSSDWWISSKMTLSPRMWNFEFGVKSVNTILLIANVTPISGRAGGPVNQLRLRFIRNIYTNNILHSAAVKDKYLEEL